MLIRIIAAADQERGPHYTEAILDSLHQANPKKLPLSLEYALHDGEVGLFCRFPTELRALITEQLADAYPHCLFQAVPDELLDPQAAESVLSASLRLVPDIFPIRTYRHFEDHLNRNVADPIAGILSLLRAHRRSGLQSRIVIHVRPANSDRYRTALAITDRMQRPFRFRRLAGWYLRAATSPRRLARLCSQGISLLSKQGTFHWDATDAVQKISHHLFETHIYVIVSVPQASEESGFDKLTELVGSFGRFTTRCARFHRTDMRHALATPQHRGFLMSSEELATIWHPPTSTVRVARLPVLAFRELEPPIELPKPIELGVATLGRVKFRNRSERFGIRLNDRRRHVAIIGKTGMGKSTLLHRLIASDIDAGRGIALIDPHGDLADAVLQTIPRVRTNDVVLFDAGDREFPVSFNPLDCRRPEQRPLVASGVVSAMKKLHGDSWGPRLEYILRNALLALLEHRGTSLASLMRLLNDRNYRENIVNRVSDPIVRGFWQDEFARWKPQLQAEAVSPIQNKVGQFLSYPALRAIIGQPHSTINLRRIMDEGQILIVNLSKGRVGEDASTLLGSLLVTELQLAAMSRADVSETHRRDFFAYVDEFQNFATESFATILSEARKYRLSLTIANQYLAQMDESTLEAVFGNVGSLLTFQVGARDAETLAEQLGGDATPADLMNLPGYTAYTRLLNDGMPSRPFSMNTLPPTGPRHDTQNSAVIRRTSQHRYGRSAKISHDKAEHSGAAV